MPDLDAYRASLQPHRHTWQPLSEVAGGCGYEWCPGCGEVRPHDDDAGDD